MTWTALDASLSWGLLCYPAVMSNQTIRTPANRAAYLAALGECGNITAAAAIVGVGRASLYEWRAQDPEFSDAWDDALTLGVAGMEDRALEFAMNGDSRLMMFLLAARKPDIYQPKQSIDVHHTHMTLRRVPLDVLRAELAGMLGGMTPTLTIEADRDPNVVPFSPKTET